MTYVVSSTSNSFPAKIHTSDECLRGYPGDELPKHVVDSLLEYNLAQMCKVCSFDDDRELVWEYLNKNIIPNLVTDIDSRLQDMDIEITVKIRNKKVWSSLRGYIY